MAACGELTDAEILAVIMTTKTKNSSDEENERPEVIEYISRAIESPAGITMVYSGLCQPK